MMTKGVHEGRYAASAPGVYAGRFRRRRERLYQLVEEFSIDMDRAYSGAEDLAPLLDGHEPIERWAAITRAGEDDTKVYVYTHETLDGAKAKAVHYVGDPLYTELPECVVNLDTGRRYTSIPAYRWQAA